jgi:uridine kinase
MEKVGNYNGDEFKITVSLGSTIFITVSTYHGTGSILRYYKKYEIDMCDISGEDYLNEYLNDCEKDFKKFIDCRKSYEQLLINNGFK